MNSEKRPSAATGFLVGAVVAVALFQLLYAVKSLHLSVRYAMPVLRDIRHELLSAAAGAKDD